jgi:hypothetical protein
MGSIPSTTKNEYINNFFKWLETLGKGGNASEGRQVETTTAAPTYRICTKCLLKTLLAFFTISPHQTSVSMIIPISYKKTEVFRV